MSELAYGEKVVEGLRGDKLFGPLLEQLADVREVGFRRLHLRVERRDLRGLQSRLRLLLLGGGDLGLQGLEGGGVVVATRLVGGVVLHALPDLRPEIATGELLNVGGGLGAELRVGDGLAAETDEVEVGRQQAVHGEVVERREQLARGEVARGAEDDHARGLGAPVLP